MLTTKIHAYVGDYMTSEEKLTLIVEAIREQLKKDIPNITPQTKFADLNIDSLDAIEMQLWLEDTKNINIENPKGSIATVSDLISLIP